MYNYKQIANYFIGKSLEDDEPITPMKLQKLIYFAHGWYLALTGEPLLDNKIEAWKYGPVILDLYHELKSFGNMPITYPIIDFDGEEFLTPKVEENDIREFLDKVWDVYSPYDAFKLSNATHIKNTPWDITWKKGKKIIDNELIKSHFKNKLNPNAAEAS